MLSPFNRTPTMLLCAGFLALLLGGCASSGKTQMLADWMQGSYSSQAQSQSDPEYFDIRLRMQRIWPMRTDGPWLYVEQARADVLSKPYRQRVYHITQVDAKTYRSDVFMLPEPVARFTGAWRPEGEAAAAIAAVKPEDLKLLDGCGVVLHWKPDQREFEGGTDGAGCASTREGAKYTTSQIIFREGLLTSWDRGFDANGQQVWGAVKGGYQFVKQTP